MLLTLAMIWMAGATLACSCLNREPNMFRNLSSGQTVVLTTADSIWATPPTMWVPSQTMGRFTIIDSLHGGDLGPGDEMIVQGADGVNCNAFLDVFQPGDTVLMAVYRSAGDTFDLPDYCGRQYVRIEGGGYGGWTLDQVLDRIDSVLVRGVEPCPCASPMAGYQGFFQNVSAETANGLFVFEGFDLSYIHEGLSLQTGHVRVLEPLHGLDASVGDQLVILGADGIHCGSLLHGLTPGDTFVMALSTPLFTTVGADTFLLYGNMCGPFVLPIRNGTTLSGTTLDEVRERIRSIVLDIEDPLGSPDVHLVPNPVRDVLVVHTSSRRLQTIDVVNLHGRTAAHRTPDTRRATIDLTGHAPGVYVIRVQTEDGWSVRRVVKL